MRIRVLTHFDEIVDVRGKINIVNINVCCTIYYKLPLDSIGFFITIKKYLQYFGNIDSISIIDINTKIA